MKKRYTLALFLLFAVSVLAGLLRLLYLRTGCDERGLLVFPHPVSAVSWLLTGAAVAFLLRQTWQVRRVTSYSRVFPASPLAAAGCVLAALAAAADVPGLWSADGMVAFLCGAAAAAGTAAFLFSAFCRFTGRQPGFLPMSVITVFLMLRLVRCYVAFMSTPQMERFLPPLFFSISLLLSVFCRAGLDAGGEGLRAYLQWTMAVVVFGCLAVSGRDRYFTALMTLSSGLELLPIRLPRKKKARPPKEGEV